MDKHNKAPHVHYSLSRLVFNLLRFGLVWFMGV